MLRLQKVGRKATDLLPLSMTRDKSSASTHYQSDGFPPSSTKYRLLPQLLHNNPLPVYSNQRLSGSHFLRIALPPTMTESSDFKETVRQQADIVRIVGDYVKLKKAGAQNYSGLCPVHGEKTPSFSVHATRQFFHCFGCGKSGDVFKFVQEREQISFPEAIKLVAEKMGIPLPKMQYSSESEAEDAGKRGKLIEMHERACKFFEDQLRRPEGAQAREYLAGRGLNEETIRTFRIGFAPDSGFTLKDRLKADFSDEMMRASGLFSWKEGAEGTGGASSSAMYSKFRNRIMFPIANENGKII